MADGSIKHNQAEGSIHKVAATILGEVEVHNMFGDARVSQNSDDNMMAYPEQETHGFAFAAHDSKSLSRVSFGLQYQEGYFPGNMKPLDDIIEKH